MGKRYWFTNEDGDNVGFDHVGNIRGARKMAQKLANELEQDIIINCGEDIVDWIYPRL